MDQSKSEPGIESLLFWRDLQKRWPGLPRPTRRHLLNAWAAKAHRLWDEGADIAGMSLELLAFKINDGVPEVIFPDGILNARPRRAIPPSQILETLAGWYFQAQDTISVGEARHFLHRFMRLESVDRETLRHTEAEIGLITSMWLADEARSLYRGELANDQEGPVRGRWSGMPDLDPAELEAAVRQAESSPERVIIKRSGRIEVSRSVLFGRDAMIKRYDLPGLADRAKYFFRASRGRRAWAAARTLAEFQIPTPEPLGFLDIYSGRVPVRSYFITAFVPEAVSAFEWLNSSYAKEPSESRAAIRRQLLAMLINLYRKGVYHADTKASNLLVLQAGDPARRAFLWIDLECVRFGTTPSRYQIIRNLVQLNGSLRSRIPEEDRMAFLRDMARIYPWVVNPDVVQRIRAWTRRRLIREVRRLCGS